MKRSLCLWSLTLIALCLSPVAMVGQDPNQELMKKLYTKIGQTVGVGNSSATGENFLVLANPGILLDPNLDYSTTAGRYQLAKLIDKVIKPDWIYRPLNKNTFDTYKVILDHHEAADIQPTAAQKTAYLQQCRVIYTDCDQALPGTPTQTFTRYQKATRDLAILEKQAEDYKNANHTEILPPDLANDLQTASNALELFAQATRVETAIASINTYEHIDPNSWWGELLGRYRNINNSETAGGVKFGKYNIYPSYPVWLDMGRSWTKLNLAQNDIEQTTTNSHSSIGGGLSGGWGFWSVGADYAHQENRSFFQLNGHDFQLSLELMRVAIDRPWMDEMVFQSRSWRWQPGSPLGPPPGCTSIGTKISDGADATTGNTPTGEMPILPTGVLLARRVSLKATWDNDLKTSFDQHTSGGASIGWGPFSFGGRFDNSDSTTYHKANAAGDTVEWDAPQIIGFFIEVLPNSPNPDKCYKFGSCPQQLPPECSGGHPFALLLSPHLTAVQSRRAALLDNAKRLLGTKYKAPMKEQHQ